MNSPAAQPSSSPGQGWIARITHDPVLWLILAVTAARLIYLFFLCPYELVEDEAHYWEWSRRLGLSYYSKGPGVAWAIAAATHLLGVTEAAVRTPSVISAAISTWALAALARDIFQDRKSGLYAAAIYNLTPIFQFTAFLMTIDSPYIACWAVAARAAWRTLCLRDPRWRWWILLGLGLGVGFLFKYTILLLLPGILIGAWFTFRSPTPIGSPPLPRSYATRILLALGVFALCSSPVIIWNIQNGWPTLRHLLGHLGLQGGDMKVKPPDPDASGYNPMWTLELVAIQVVLFGVATAQILGAVRWARRLPTQDPARTGARFLIACSVPILLFYLAVTFFTRAEGNWPVAGFVSLVVLAAGWTARSLHASPDPAVVRKTFAQSMWRASLWAGIVVGVLMLRVDLLSRIPFVGPRIPIGRLIGAREQALHVDELTAALRLRTGKDPLVIVQHYGQASRLAFYLTGRPTVLCASSNTGGRKTQYDYWPDTSLASPDLLGRPGVLVGGELQQWLYAFTQVEPIGQLRGESKKNRQAFLGIDYKLFPSARRKPDPTGSVSIAAPHLDSPPSARLLSREAAPFVNPGRKPWERHMQPTICFLPPEP